MTWKQARQPRWDDHPAVITDRGKVVWWLAIYRYGRRRLPGGEGRTASNK